MAQSKESKQIQILRKNSAIGLINPIKAQSSIPFKWKIGLLFALFGLFWTKNRVGSKGKGSESKSNISNLLSHQFSPVENTRSLVSNFAATGHKGRFRKILTYIFRFGCFSWYHPHIFEKNDLDFLLQNIILNWNAPFLRSQKSKPKKLVCPFLLALFHFETNLIK